MGQGGDITQKGWSSWSVLPRQVQALCWHTSPPAPPPRWVQVLPTQASSGRSQLLKEG